MRDPVFADLSMYAIAHECDSEHRGHRKRRDDPMRCECGYWFTFEPCDVHGPSLRRRPVVRAAELSLGPRGWVMPVPKRVLSHCARCGGKNVMNTGRAMCSDCHRLGEARIPL